MSINGQGVLRSILEAAYADSDYSRADLTLAAFRRCGVRTRGEAA